MLAGGATRWRHWLALACSTRRQGRRGRAGVGRLLSLALAGLLGMLLGGCLRPSLASAEEQTPETVLESVESVADLGQLEARGIDVLDEGEDWPEDAKGESLRAKRVDGGLLLAQKTGGGVAIKAIGSDPAGAAWTLFTSIMGEVASRYQAIYAIQQDLAWRWYQADAEKRAKLPLLPSNDARFAPLGHWSFTEAGTPQQQYDAWHRYNDQYWPLMVAYQLQRYDGGAWSVAGNVNVADFEEYAKWYDWFEGEPYVPPTGDGSTIETYSTPIALRYVYGQGAAYLAQDVTVTATETQIESINSKAANKYSLMWWQVRASNASTSTETSEGYLAVSSSPITVTYETETTTPKVNYTVTITSDTSITYYAWNATNNFNSVSWTMYRTLTSASRPSLNHIRMWYQTGTAGSGDAGSQEPVYPEPSQDTIRPVGPTVTEQEPDTVTYVTNETTETTADLTPILQAIRILNSNVVAGFGNIEAVMETCCQNMRNLFGGWMQTLTQWLSQMLDVMEDEYRWLQAIYYKLGSGQASQPDVVTDDGGYWDWLAALAALVLGNLPATLAELSGAAEALTGVFPFSVPWDLAAVLGLFVAEPVAPVITLPWGFGPDSVANVTVDCSQWSGVMAVAREVEFVLFAAGLALHTRDLLSNTEVE